MENQSQGTMKSGVTSTVSPRAQENWDKLRRKLSDWIGEDFNEVLVSFDEQIDHALRNPTQPHTITLQGKAGQVLIATPDYARTGSQASR